MVSSENGGCVFAELERAVQPAGLCVLERVSGRCLYSTGELDQSKITNTRPLAQLFDGGSYPSGVEVCGRKYQVVSRTTQSVYGVAKNRRRSLVCRVTLRRGWWGVSRRPAARCGLTVLVLSFFFAQRRHPQIANLLPCGVMIGVFPKSCRPQLVAPLVEQFSDALRR